MHFEEDDILLRIMIGEKDSYHGRPLYEEIVTRPGKRDSPGPRCCGG